MKKSILITGLLSYSTILMASNENSYFMSVGIGKANATLQATANVNNNVAESVTTKDDANFIEVRIGKIVNHKHKFGISYATYNTESKVDLNSISLSYAYYIDTTKKWQPYIGGSYSYIGYTEQINNTNIIDTEINLSSNAFIANIGIDYEIDKKQFLSFSYDFSVAISGEGSVRGTSNGQNLSITGEIDKIDRLGVSYNYKF